MQFNSNKKDIKNNKTYEKTKKGGTKIEDK